MKGVSQICRRHKQHELRDSLFVDGNADEFPIPELCCWREDGAVSRKASPTVDDELGLQRVDAPAFFVEVFVGVPQAPYEEVYGIACDLTFSVQAVDVAVGDGDREAA